MNEDLKDLLLKLATELGRRPTKYDINNCEYLPSANTLHRKGVHLSGNWIDEYLFSLNPKECKQCLSLIPFEKSVNDFCNNSCSASFNNKLRPTNRVCKFCCTPIPQKKASDYCCKDCYLKQSFIGKFLDWFYLGKHFGNATIKSFLSAVSGYKCSLCAISSWNDKEITLEVEHIDGNSEDSSPNNVCLLCPNCHSQTDTYRAKNIGNGRFSRRKRYQEGKSY